MKEQDAHPEREDAHPEREDVRSEQAIRDFYDQNTRRFLWIGGSRQPMTIHRAVWGPGVRTRAEALDYSHQLILEQLREVTAHAGHHLPVHVLDMGCGVGGSLFYLALHCQAALLGSGVTLSPVQAEVANATSRRLGLADQCSFYVSSYLDLPALPPALLAFAVESFVLSPDPAQFFTSAAGALSPAGRLVIIDDFLLAPSESNHPRRAAWIAQFQQGWYAASLITAKEAVQHARLAGLRLRTELDLTPWLRTGTLRDRAVALTVGLGQVLPLRNLLGQPYWDSLSGGHALQQCLLAGITKYQMLVFEKGPSG